MAYNQILLTLMARFPEDSHSLVRSPSWKAWHGFQNFHKSGRTSLALLFSSLLVTHPTGMIFDFIMIETLLPSYCSFFFVFECGISSFGGFQCSVNGCSAASCNFDVLRGGEMSVYLLLKKYFFFFFFLFLVLVLEGLVGLHRTIQVQLLWH